MKSKNQILKFLALFFVLLVITIGLKAQGPYATTGAQTVCMTGQVEPYGVTLTPNSTYVWTIDGETTSPNWTLSATNLNLATVIWNSPGVYHVQVWETTADGCRQPLPVEVEVTISPIALVDAGADQVVCATTPNVTLAGIRGGSATSGTWSGGLGTFAPNATTLTAVYTPSAAEIAAGTVTLTLTSNDPDGPCNAVTDQVTITINQNPVVIANNNGQLCVAATLQLSATPSGGTGNYAYVWSGPDNFSSTLQNPSIANVTTAAGGNYTVTITDIGSTSCTSAATTTVIVSPLPITSPIYHN